MRQIYHVCVHVACKKKHHIPKLQPVMEEDDGSIKYPGNEIIKHNGADAGIFAPLAPLMSTGATPQKAKVPVEERNWKVTVTTWATPNTIFVIIQLPHAMESQMLGCSSFATYVSTGAMPAKVKVDVKETRASSNPKVARAPPKAKVAVEEPNPKVMVTTLVAMTLKEMEIGKRFTSSATSNTT
ncbi:unnamed protein product [Prunus brigantina]